MQQILDSLKNITTRWLRTQTPLLSNITIGDVSINVLSASRFKIGDQILIRSDNNDGQYLYIKDVFDCHTILLQSRARFNWNITDNSILVQKTFKYQWLKGVYLGQPSNIPQFPAVCIKAQTKASQWMTLRSTNQTFNVKLTIYVDDAWQQSGYRWMIRAAQTIQTGLKQNFYPLVGPYRMTTLIADAPAGSTFLKVNDTTNLWYPGMGRIEDPYQAQQISFRRIVDINTVQLAAPLCHNYFASYNPLVIWSTRMIYNTWPSGIQYGSVFKGTMLKAAQITWFAKQQQCHGDLQGQPAIF